MRESETFERRGIQNAGRYVQQYAITCCQCGNQSHISVAKASGALGIELVRKKFHQQGWIVAKRRKDDVCPSCIAKSRQTKLVSKGLKVMEAPKKPTPAELQPTVESVFRKAPQPEPQPVHQTTLGSNTVSQRNTAEPSKEMKRSIREAIQTAYRGERLGYMPGVTDATIARDLGGCPVSWITDVRDDFFGPAVALDHPDVAKLVTEFDSLKDDLALFVERGALFQENIERLRLRTQALEKRIDQLRGKA